MAGMLPGVEAARRRRCWSESLSSSSSSNGIGRSSFCLYANSSLLVSSSNSHLQQRSLVNNDEEKLQGFAREAKERLDQRLRSQHKKLGFIRRNSQARERVVDQDQVDTTQPPPAAAAAAAVAAAVPTGRMRKSASRRLMNWGSKLSSWKSSEQEECAICLEQYQGNYNSVDLLLTHLPCAHRFHSKCLVPWLENNAHCPYCRTPI